MERGKFIVLESGEGGGKTSQVRALSSWFEACGIDYVSTREPGGNRIGGDIRRILLNRDNKELDSLAELFLYSADRRVQYSSFVVPSLEEGKWVLSDRSWPSTEAYQGAAGKLDMGLIREMNRLATGGVLPDLLYVIDIDPRVGLSKEVNPDRFASKAFEYHVRVRDGYNDILDREKGFAVRVPYISGGQDEMQKMIRSDIVGKYPEYFTREAFLSRMGEEDFCLLELALEDKGVVDL